MTGSENGSGNLSRYYDNYYFDIDCYQINITYWYHPDYLGSIEWVTNADGRPVEYFWYSPWGETLQEDNSWRGRFSSPFKFTGHIEDEELLCHESAVNKSKDSIGTTIVSTFEKLTISEQTGLTYAGARYYPARVGKWLSVDPLAHEFPSWTPYNYTMNNPVNMIDPDGRAPVFDTDGNLLGATSDGWGGVAIVMCAEDYNESMSDNDALGIGGQRLDKYGEGIRITDDA